MNALNKPFGFTATYDGESLSLREGKHFRIYATGANQDFGTQLTKRQIDLLRICMSLYIADSWAKRRSAHNRHRVVTLEVELLDVPFWQQSDSRDLLKECADFVSGDDNWSFCFTKAKGIRHDRQPDLFQGSGLDALVTLYSGGLDSASGLALRAVQENGRTIIPVTLRHQKQKSKLIRDHFHMLIEKKLVNPGDLHPFQTGAFVKNKSIERHLGIRLREVTHRCRPMLFMSMAGLVADTVSTPTVEVFESGVGAINLPLMNGAANYRTTRSTHPYFLRLISKLVSRVNDSSVTFTLPFADDTKAEMVKRLKDIGLEELACKSISCILHPLRRNGTKQCGSCPACVYRRQAMIAAKISEPSSNYCIDLFSPRCVPTDKQRQAIRIFLQQAGRLAELESRIPPFFRQFLYATRAVSRDEEIAPIAEVHKRYRREWAAIIADARRSGLAWVASACPQACAQGANA